MAHALANGAMNGPRWRPKTLWRCGDNRLKVGAQIEPYSRTAQGLQYGVSDPEIRKKFSEPIWLRYKHECDKQNWPWWKRLIHRLQPCPICRPEKVKQ